MTGNLTKHQTVLLVNALEEDGKVRTWAVKMETLARLRDLGLIRMEPTLKSQSLRHVLHTQVLVCLREAINKINAHSNHEDAHSEVKAAGRRLSELINESYFLTEEGRRVAKEAKKS